MYLEGLPSLGICVRHLSDLRDVPSPQGTAPATAPLAQRPSIHEVPAGDECEGEGRQLTSCLVVGCAEALQCLRCHGRCFACLQMSLLACM